MATGIIHYFKRAWNWINGKMPNLGYASVDMLSSHLVWWNINSLRDWWKTKLYLHFIYIISAHWHGRCDWNPSSRKTRHQSFRYSRTLFFHRLCRHGVNKNIPALHSQYHGDYWHGDARRQDISSHGDGDVFLGQLGTRTLRVKLVDRSVV